MFCCSHLSHAMDEESCRKQATQDERKYNCKMRWDCNPVTPSLIPTPNGCAFKYTCQYETEQKLDQEKYEKCLASINTNKKK